ncbi:MAG: YeeE/YedE family protein [Rhodospirillales bacterium]
MDSLEPRFLLLAGALAVGFIYGTVARASGFCLRSAVIEVIDHGPARQAAAWALALPLAILGTQVLSYLGVIDLKDSIYLGSSVMWLALIVGGLLFGFGMVITRGCGGRHLVLAAGGNLRAWLVIVVMALSAYATNRGILALPRIWIEAAGTVSLGDTPQALPLLIAGPAGAGTAALAIAGILMAAGLLAAFRLRNRPGVAGGLAAGLVVGLLIPVGWYVSGVLGFDDFNPSRPVSLTFTTPMGNALQFLMTYTGTAADFGVTTIGGTLAGAFAWAAATRTLKAEGFDSPGHMARYALGAVMMGFGGVLALGCTIGAGLSGMSTLSLGSLIALASIVTGGAVGHHIKTRIVGGRAPKIVPAE